MKKAIPLVMSALMATSFIGVPAVAQAKTPAARTASEKQETQYDLSGCDLRPRNYRSNFIEGNGPDKDTFVVVDRNTNREVDKSQYKFTFQKLSEEGYWEETGESFPTKKGSYIIYAVATKDGKYSGKTYGTSFSIVAKNDLALATMQNGCSNYAYTGKQIKPSITLIDAEGKTIDPSCYRLNYVDSNWTSLTEAPTEPGQYYVSAVAIEGKGYTGTSYSQYIKIVDVTNISSFDIVKSITVKDSKGNIVDPSEYTLVFSQYGVDLTEVPTTVGSYSVRAVAKEGSSKVGESYSTSLEIKDPLDLNCLSVANSIDGIPLGYTPPYRTSLLHENQRILLPRR